MERVLSFLCIIICLLSQSDSFTWNTITPTNAIIKTKSIPQHNPFILYSRKHAHRLKVFQRHKEKHLDLFESLFPNPDEDEGSPEYQQLKEYQQQVIEETTKLKPFKRGEFVNGTIDGYNIFGFTVDLGMRGQGFLPYQRATLDFVENSHIEDYDIGVGDTIEATVIEFKHDQWQLTRSPQLMEMAWGEVKKAYQEQAIVNATLWKNDPGGVLCKVFGRLTGYLPRSQLSHVPLANRTVGGLVQAKLMRLDLERGQIVLSERMAIAANSPVIEKNKVYRCKVSSIKDFGCFVDFDSGHTGLLHLSQISHYALPPEILPRMFRVGAILKVFVFENDLTTKRIAVSTKVFENKPGEILQNMKGILEEAEERGQAYLIRKTEEKRIRELQTQEILSNLEALVNTNIPTSASSSEQFMDASSTSNTPELGSKKVAFAADSLQSILTLLDGNDFNKPEEVDEGQQEGGEGVSQKNETSFIDQMAECFDEHPAGEEEVTGGLATKSMELNKKMGDIIDSDVTEEEKIEKS